MSDARRQTLYELIAALGIALVCVVVPLVAGRTAFGPLPLDAVILTVPIAVLAAYPLMRRVGVAQQPWFSVELPGLAFVAVAMLSAAVVAPGIAAASTVARYAGYLLFVAAVGTVCRNAGARRFLLWVFSFAGAATFAIAAMQYLAPARAIGLLGLSPDVKTRVYATFNNPNFYGEFLILLFAATLALVLIEKGVKRLVSGALLIATTGVLLLTQTRGSWLALAVGVTVAVLMVNIRLIWPLILVAAAGIVAVPGVASRVVSIFSLEGTASFRLQLWRIAGEAIATHPWLGAGPGEFYTVFRETVTAHPELGVGYLQYGAHNSFLTIFAETGILGGLMFVWLIFEITRQGLYLGGRVGLERRARLENAALTAGIIAFPINAMVSNSFQHPSAAIFFFVLAGMQAGLGMSVLGAPEAALAPARAPRGAVASSLVARAGIAVARWSSAAWHASLTRRAVTAAPPLGGRVMARSRFGVWALGAGLRPDPEALSPREAALTTTIARSLVGRASLAFARWASATWSASVTHRAFALGGRVLAASYLGAHLLGTGRSEG